jgi:hypothetical protein
MISDVHFIGLVNVNDLEAVGDGVTNDFSAIQAFFVKARRLRGLHFNPSKVYFINTDELHLANNILDFTGVTGLTIDGAGSMGSQETKQFFLI